MLRNTLLFLSFVMSSLYAQTHFIPVINSGSNMTVIVPSAAVLQINGQNIVNGDEIGVFDSTGQCVGAILWAGNNAAIVVYGENTLPDNTVLPGIKTGEVLLYKIWDASQNVEIDVSPSYSSGSSVYAENNISALSQLTGLQKFTITTSVTGPGSISASNPEVFYGADTTLSFSANSSKDKLDSILIDGSNIGTPTNYTFTNVISNHAVAAFFHAIVYSESIVVTHAISFTNEINIDSVLQVNQDTVVTTTTDSITTDTTFTTSDSLADGVVYLTAIDTVINLDTIQISQNINILKYNPTVTISAIGPGSVSPTGAQVVNNNGNLFMSFSANSVQDKLDSVLVDGISIGSPSSYSLNNVILDHSVVAYFHSILYSESIGVTHGVSSNVEINIDSVSQANLDTIVTTTTDSIATDTTFTTTDSLADGVIFLTTIDTAISIDTIQISQVQDTLLLRGSQSTSIQSGWNFVSLYVSENDMSIASIFGSIPGLLLVKDEDGNVYMPSIGIDNIGTLSVQKGYQVYTNQASNLSLNGIAVKEADESIALTTGWHLVPFWSSVSKTPADAFQSILSNLVIAKDESGAAYLPDYGIDNILTINRGESYLIYIDAPSTLTFGN